jgi:hypothetical protein
VISILVVSVLIPAFAVDGLAGWTRCNKFPDSYRCQYAISFRKDVLIHDAHRHPYMERWGLLYLLKLRHGASFGTPAGAAWRILLTLALMPWLRNYRVYPQLQASEWLSARHSSALVQPGGGSYEDLYARNLQLELEITRLKQRVSQLENDEGNTVIHL